MNEVSPNSALYWLPRITEANLPVPISVIVEYDHQAILGGMEGSAEFPAATAEAVRAACDQIGYPCFLRTDLCSAKHDGPSSYRIDRPEDVLNRICRTAEDAEMKLWPFSRPSAFLVRRFLALDAPFAAFYGLPIAREFRFFATPGRVHCVHPYWPPEAIAFFGEYGSQLGPHGWQENLAEISQINDLDRESLGGLATKAAAACPDSDAWSVDFCRDTAGKWWLLDMARAEDSFHWDGCKENP